MQVLRGMAFAIFGLILTVSVIEGWIYFVAWCVRKATARGLLP